MFIVCNKIYFSHTPWKVIDVNIFIYLVYRKRKRKHNICSTVETGKTDP